MLIIVMVGLLRDVLTPCTSPVEVGGKSTNLDTYSYVEIGGPLGGHRCESFEL